MPSTNLPTAADLRERRPGQNRERRPGQNVGQHAAAVRQAISDHHDAALRIAENAETARRDDWLASERRSWDSHQDEVRRLTALLHTIENSPEGRAIDYSQFGQGDGIVWSDGSHSGGDNRGRILAPEQRVADWTAAHKPVRPEDRDLSMGNLFCGWLTGRWDGAELEHRVLVEGTTSGGGILVPEPISASIIDAARNASVVLRAGARTIPMDSKTLTVPRLTGTTQPAWRAENEQIAEDDLAFDGVTFTAKSLAVIVKASRELLEDARDVDGIVRQDLGAALALEIDRVLLRGTGSNDEPTGLRNTSGITVVPATTGGDPDDGGPVDYDTLLDLRQAVAAANYMPGAFVMNPRTANTLAKLKDDSGSYLLPPAALDGVPVLVSNGVPKNITTGAATTTSEVYVGDWSKLWLGVRTQLQISTLNERYADYGQVAFLMWYRADVQVVQPAAFAVATGVTS
jgi:HK97 family phage major capsid protein